MRLLYGSLIALVITLSAPAQQTFYKPLNIKKAYEKGTRSESGMPGENYWINSADYTIKASVDPAERKLSGEARIKYYNNSPDTLNSIVLRLYQDFYKYGAARNFAISKEAVSNGVNISLLSVDGKELDISDPEKVQRGNTLLTLRPEMPLNPSSEIEIDISWSFIIPKGSNIRMGTYDSTTFFVAYWYPQVAVYDDIDGWDVIGYNGEQEFYNDFNNYKVELTVPNNFGVWATGVLNNPEQVLKDQYLKRFKAALSSDTVISIIKTEDLGHQIYADGSEFNTWKYAADNVPDFAFGMSDHYLWDASVLNLDNNNVFISAVYNKASKDFYSVAGIARKSIEYFSTDLPGVTYPYPSMTIFNGSGGMEFPMIVNNGSTEVFYGAVHLTSHEILHTYFPFYMGINEKKYAWMDEGWAVMLPFKFQSSNATGYDPYARYVGIYEKQAGGEMDMPPMTPTIMLRSPAYRTASYNRPAVAYQYLMEIMGEKKFKQALNEYINRWKGKHPIPFDFFNTFNETAGEDLSWFWKPWFFEKGYPDLALGRVEEDNGVIRIYVERIGTMPVPVHINITTSEGNELQVKRSADIWKNGDKGVWIEHELVSPAAEVKLGSIYAADVNKDNNKLKK